MDDNSYYAPSTTADRGGIEDEIDITNTLIQSLDPTDPRHLEFKTYYRRTLDRLYTRLAQYPSASGYQLSAAPSPGGSSASGSRKRNRDESNDDASLGTTPGGSPGTPLTMDYHGYSRYQAAAPSHAVKREMREMPADADFIDLTVDEPVVDPFPELLHAYQPGHMNQSVEAFNQEWLNTDALAQFLAAPMPAGSAYGYPAVYPPSAPQAGPAYHAVVPNSTPFTSLEDELFGGAADEFAGPEAVQDLIENIRLHDEVEPEAREQTPKAMCSTLMEHQKIALTWLLKMERGKSKAAILADEMGLGKTVEALALILANPSDTPACKTTLIVAPVALMRQWEKEIKRHVHQSHHLSVYVYHGTSKKADFDKLRTYDVVLTTFGTLAQEMKVKEKRMLAEAEQREQQATEIKRPAREMITLLGRKSMWYRVILDEAQCIKNRNTLTSKAANDLQARHRLCMTGTPMMVCIPCNQLESDFVKSGGFASKH